MTDSREGWYPDPSGDTSKLRYWDGCQWTNQYADAPGAASSTSTQANACSGDNTAYAAQGATYTGSQSVYDTQYIQQSQPVRTVSSQDSMLRLIAFVFCVVSTVSVCWALIPLIWMIPMSVYAWRVYKGVRPNTVAFGVCTLLFVSLVAGILLLVSTKDQ